MIITQTLKDPFVWHRHFAFLPTMVEEIDTHTEGRERVLIRKKAWLQFIERKLERNLSGAERWVYRLP